MDAALCLFYDRRKLVTNLMRGRDGGGDGDDDNPQPTVTLQDLLTGRVLPGVDTLPCFDVLAWRGKCFPHFISFFFLP